MATQNGGPTQNAAPSLNVLAQYIKDFSFENPNAPRSLAAPVSYTHLTLPTNREV